eukprot:gb/GECH01012695.1/.p1 GENE.gb/GECH01012695.1/~~gb/GECH01012695.1/.p1  ORF type:complete len:320 (+),score=21.19 gb/GECH01012695.1/:1-960(+)
MASISTTATGSSSTQQTTQQMNRKTPAHLLAGGVAGTFSTLATQPFDVVKTRMIGRQKPSESTVSARYALRSVMAENGIAGLWRGSVPSAYRVGPGAAIYFSCIHNLTQIIGDTNEEEGMPVVTPLQGLLVGSVSRGLVAVMTCPIVVVKTRFEYSRGPAKSKFFQTLYSIGRNEGMSGLFRGVLATLVRDAPYSGVYVGVYNYAKTPVARMYNEPSTSAAKVTLTCGAFAATVSTMCTHPFDVIRTRLQLQHFGISPVTEPNSAQYSGVRKTAVRIFRDEGTRGLFRGLSLRIVKRSISSAITWTLYEQMTKMMMQNK